jgi:hypothetical protein
MDDVTEQRLTSYAEWTTREHRNMEWAEVFDLLDSVNRLGNIDPCQNERNV